jgi:hypothetical protein
MEHAINFIKKTISVQRLYGKRHHPLLWVGLRAARGHITRGVPKCLNYCKICLMYTHFTVGRVSQSI